MQVLGTQTIDKNTVSILKNITTDDSVNGGPDIQINLGNLFKSPVSAVRFRGIIDLMPQPTTQLKFNKADVTNLHPLILLYICLDSRYIYYMHLKLGNIENHPLVGERIILKMLSAKKDEYYTAVKNATLFLTSENETTIIKQKFWAHVNDSKNIDKLTATTRVYCDYINPADSLLFPREFHKANTQKNTNPFLALKDETSPHPILYHGNLLRINNGTCFNNIPRTLLMRGRVEFVIRNTTLVSYEYSVKQKYKPIESSCPFHYNIFLMIPPTISKDDAPSLCGDCAFHVLSHTILGYYFFPLVGVVDDIMKSSFLKKPARIGPVYKKDSITRITTGKTVTEKPMTISDYLSCLKFESFVINGRTFAQQYLASDEKIVVTDANKLRWFYIFEDSTEVLKGDLVHWSTGTLFLAMNINIKVENRVKYGPTFVLSLSNCLTNIAIAGQLVSIMQANGDSGVILTTIRTTQDVKFGYETHFVFKKSEKIEIRFTPTSDINLSRVSSLSFSFKIADYSMDLVLDGLETNYGNRLTHQTTTLDPTTTMDFSEAAFGIVDEV